VGKERGGHDRFKYSFSIMDHTISRGVYYRGVDEGSMGGIWTLHLLLAGTAPLLHC